MVQFRAGSVEDLDAVVALFDANVSWLVAQGRADQWGSEPFSENPKLVGFVRELLSSGTVTIAARAEMVPLRAGCRPDAGTAYVTATAPGSHATSRTTCESLTPRSVAASVRGTQS